MQECNEGARKAERIHEMLVVSNQLDFGDVKAISVMSASRWLVKKGEMQRLMWRDIEARLTFGRKIHKQTVYVFLFTDLLVITKKKGYVQRRCISLVIEIWSICCYFSVFQWWRIRCVGLLSTQHGPSWWKRPRWNDKSYWQTRLWARQELDPTHDAAESRKQNSRDGNFLFVFIVVRHSPNVMTILK